jgi:site-specific DNA-methyltransferase (adenine-specific)
MKTEVLTGSAYDLIREIPNGSVDLMVTSPPYFQQRPRRIGGEVGDVDPVVGNELLADAYIRRLVDLCDILHRKLTPTGSMVWNIGDKSMDGGYIGIPQRFMLEIIGKAGEFLPSWRLINEIQWVRRNPKPNAAMMKRRLLPAHEPCYWFTPYTPEYKFNPDGWTPDMKGYSHSKPGPKLGERYAEIIEYGDHDLTPFEQQNAIEALREAVRRVHAGQLAGFRMRIRGHHKPRDGVTDDLPNGYRIIRLTGSPMKRDVLTTSFTRVPGVSHTAVFPEELAANFIRMLTDPGDTVLDPFVGAGTTLVACKKLGRIGIGFEIDEAYADEARARLEGTEGRA